MANDCAEPLTPTKLSAAVGISVPYASQILSNRRTPALGMAIRIFRETGAKFGPISGASDDEIAVLERFQ